MKKQIECKQCNGTMVPTTHRDSDRGLQAMGCLVMTIGLVALFFFPIGTLLGIALIIGSISMGYKKRKVWKCQDCGYFFERS